MQSTNAAKGCFVTILRNFTAPGIGEMPGAAFGKMARPTDVIGKTDLAAVASSSPDYGADSPAAP